MAEDSSAEERVYMALAGNKFPSKEDIAEIGQDSYDELFNEIQDMRDRGIGISIPN